MKILYKVIVLAAGAFLMLSTAQADIPISLTEQNKEGNETTWTGKIAIFRAQAKNVEIGPQTDRLDAEILVVLDKHPGIVFGIRLHEDEPSAREMIETLRVAYLGKLPVTIQSQAGPTGKKNLKINWVQLGK